jgi:methanesulfonate monooxygenase small subunit
MSTNGTEMVKDAIYQACLNLDENKWDDWLDQCGGDFKYSVTAYSPEIGKDMKYLGLNREELKEYFALLPKHNTDHSPLRRHATVYSVNVDDEAKTAEAVTSFLITQEMFDGVNAPLDTGENHLFVVGKYYDRFDIKNGEAVFTERETRIHTRRLDKGSHWVF